VMALFGSRLVRQCGLTGQVPVKSFHFFCWTVLLWLCVVAAGGG
jgi:hypothetical protein